MTGFAVQVSDLTLRYGRTTALDRVSVALPAGGIHGLLGRNGSGKTTFLSILAALRAPSGGRVLVDGEDPFENARIMERSCLIREAGDLLADERVATNLRYQATMRPTLGRDASTRARGRVRDQPAGPRESALPFGEVQVSHLQFARTGGLWFLFTLGIVTFAGMLTTHVATGGTRRSFVAATLAVGLGSALVYALALGVGLEIEGAVYAANGWPHLALEGEADPSGGIAVTFPPAVVSYAAGSVSGRLVGLTYYRFGGLRGTALLPLALAPIFLLTVSGLGGGTARTFLEAADLPFGLSLLVDVAVLGAAIAAYYLLARRVPVRKAAT